MKIFVSAAEISSDIHAEKILSSIIRQFEQNNPGHRVEISGIGGPRLRSLPGFKPIEKAESMRAMGFVEVIGKISYLQSVLDRAVEFISGYQPDLILTFDYPDFHFRLMRTLKRKNIAQKALRICGIPPKVWVWRSHRVERIRELYHGVWVIFPFEKEFYRKKGIPVIYEGNPLIADLFEKASREVFSLDGAEVSIAVMPGSREAELKYHLPLVQPTLQLLAQKIKKPVRALIPVPEGISFEHLKQVLVSDSKVEYQFIERGTHEILSQTQVGLIKSGTSTLEAAVLGCVPVIFYKASRISEWIFNWVVRYSGPVGLPNILLNIRDRKDSAFEEFLGVDATPEALSTALAKLVQTPALLHEKKNLGLALKTALVPSADVSAAVAAKMLSWLHLRPYSEPKRIRSLGIALISLVWSSINWVRRKFYDWGFLKSILPKANSILVGNLQAGGSGKTPIVIAIAREAIQKNKRVAVVSRGYGSEAEARPRIILPTETSVNALQIGDEPIEIKNKVPGVILGVGADRVKVLEMLPEVDLVIFDDGFQNLSFKGHHTVLCVTDRGRSEIPYRDFASQASRADQVINVQELDWAVHALPVAPIWLLCGVGDPQAVVRFYKKRGVVIKRLIAKPDHAQFDESEVKELIEASSHAGCLLAVTEKDFAKLSDKFPTLFVLKRELRSVEWIRRLF